MPTLSVIIPNYNHAKYLREALDSIFSQSRLAEEVIVIDDHSTDQSLSILKEYQKQLPQLTLLENEKNLGPVATLNKGIATAQGDYLIFGSSDDYFLPRFFEKTMQELEKHPEVGLCCGQMKQFWDGQSYTFRPLYQKIGKTLFCIPSTKMMSAMIKRFLFIHTNAAVFKREAVNSCGGFYPELESITDWYLGQKIACKYGAIFIPEFFAAFRMVPTSYSAILKKGKQKNLIHQALIKRIQQEDKATQEYFFQTGILGQVGIKMVLFLWQRPKYWRFFLQAFLKNCHSFYTFRIRSRFIHSFRKHEKGFSDH